MYCKNVLTVFSPLRRPREANYADIIKIAIMVIETTFKDSKQK